MNKKAMTSQVIFYIMMSILMVAIIMFGISKMSTVQETLSETQRLEIQKQIASELNYCQDTLNRGGQISITLESEIYNSLCIIKDKIPDSIDPILADELDILRETTDNIILFDNRTGEINIIDSFAVPKQKGVDSCFTMDSNSNKLEIIIKC